MSPPRQTHSSVSLGGSFRFAVFLFFLVLHPDLSKAQNLIEFPAPVELEFPGGYDIYGADGGFVKSVPGPTKATIQAYIERDGQRIYLSDWSYQRFKSQGINPNVIVGKASPQSTPEVVLQRDELLSSPVALPSIRGTNEDGETWAYEFVEVSGLFRERLWNDRDRELLLSDPQWIVTGHFISLGEGRGMHELAFYRADDLRIAFRVRVPNYVMRVAWSPQREQFLLVTGKGNGDFSYVKYPDDITQALVVIDPSRRTLERTRLLRVRSDGDDMWNYFDTLGAAEWSGNNIVLEFPEGSGKDLLPLPDPRFRSAEFSEIRVTTRTVRESQLFEQRPASDRSGLSQVLLGNFIKGPYDGGSPETVVSTVKGGDQAGTHLVRATPKGGLFDLNLNTLRIRYHRLHNEALKTPGLFEDGSLRGLADEVLVVRSDKEIFRKELRPLLSGEEFQVEFSERAALIATRRDESSGEFRIMELNPSGETLAEHQVRLPASDWMEWRLFGARRSFATLTGDFSDGRFWREYSIETGRQIGPPVEDVTGKGIRVSDHFFGVAPEGWQITATCVGAHTAGRDYAVALQRDSDRRTIELGEKSSAQRGSPPLAMDLSATGGSRALVLSCGLASAELLSVDLASGTESQVRSWEWTPSDGAPLYSEELRWFFVPIPSGFAVHELFGTDPVSKRFDLIFNGEQDYVIVLPSGEYAGSPGCESFLNLSDKSGALVPASILAPWRNRPAAVMRVLGGREEDAAALEATTSRWLVRLGIDPSQPEPTAAQLADVKVSNRPALFQQVRDLKFPVSVRTGDEPVTSVRVLVNGVEAGELVEPGTSLPASQQQSLTAMLRLSTGQNWIEVIATDGMGRNGASERFRVIHQSGGQSGRRFVVTMGVSDYEQAFEDLPGATRDTKAIANVLSESRPGSTEVLELVNGEVTRACYGKIREFLSRAEEDDEIFLFLAGHGDLDEQLEFNLIPGVGDDLPVGEVGIPLRDLINIIEGTRSRKRLILIDSCHSGLLGEAGELKRQSQAIPVSGSIFRPMEDLFRLPGVIRGVTVVAGSRGFESSFEDKASNAGFFTSAVTEAFDLGKGDLDKDGGIALSELRDYVTVRLPEISELHLKDHPSQKRQIPSTVAFESDQDFFILGITPE